MAAGDIEVLNAARSLMNRNVSNPLTSSGGLSLSGGKNPLMDTSMPDYSYMEWGLTLRGAKPARELDAPFSGSAQQKDTSDGTLFTVGTRMSEPEITAKAVMHYADSVANIMQGGAAISNGYLSKMSAETKATAYDIQAQQTRREAKMLLDNQMEVTRAAQMDANRYRIAGDQTETKQKVAMAGSGFAVGKGTYQNTLNTTQARVNYNISNLMLKADLTNAEMTRKAGTAEANAIISEANANIARKEGKMAVMNGWISGISNFISAAASFYCGYETYKPLSTQNKNTDKKKS